MRARRYGAAVATASLALGLLVAACLVQMPQQLGHAFAEQPAKPGGSQSAKTGQTERNKAGLDAGRLRPADRIRLLAARRAAEWLFKANQPDGLFLPGIEPGFGQVVEPPADQVIQQALAAAALARAARLLNEPRYAARSSQCILTLLVLTRADPHRPGTRTFVFASSQASRLEAAACLVCAIQHLPQPGADLHQAAQELAEYIRQMQQPDGLFLYRDDLPADHPENQHSEAVLAACGRACQALVLMPHKNEHGEALAKACHQAYARWEKRPSLSASLLSRGLFECSGASAQAERELWAINDWLTQMQYTVQAPQARWRGGFARGPADRTAPDVGGARAVGSLTYAARQARSRGDTVRLRAYETALDEGVAFLISLQFTPANMRQFAEWFQPSVYGAFASSPATSLVRLDGHAEALWALLDYLEYSVSAGP
ncbi:MAG: hypothetical protein C4297_05785 [Gemmataceae bacterium]